ncbi:MAG: hypothetical protein CMJ87_04390 [Planctomycetes bacterium]|nr:hypothetical protein [Planctomycetota bacterium]
MLFVQKDLLLRSDLGRGWVLPLLHLVSARPDQGPGVGPLHWGTLRQFLAQLFFFVPLPLLLSSLGLFLGIPLCAGGEFGGSLVILLDSLVQPGPRVVNTVGAGSVQPHQQLYLGVNLLGAMLASQSLGYRGRNSMLSQKRFRRHTHLVGWRR